MKCRYNKIKIIPRLNEKIAYVDIGNNEITNLPNIPKNMYEISIENNPIVELLGDLNLVFTTGRGGRIIGRTIGEQIYICKRWCTDINKIINTINKFREVYYTLKFINKFRKFYYLKVVEPKMKKHYSPENLEKLLDTMKDENNVEEFDNLLACW
jgi:Leucine-rich repeat (LRR) protein